MIQIHSKSILSALTAALLAFSLAACSGNGTTNSSSPISDNSTPAEVETVTIVHDYGETELPVNPQKIICFDMGIIDVLDYVGVEIGGRPNGNFPAHLAKFNDDSVYLNTGNMKEADFEVINEYGPDVIFISGRLASSYDELSKIAPTVYFATPSSDYMNDFYKNIETLSRIFPDQADAMLAKAAELDEATSVLAADAQASGLNALVIMANDGSISFFGSGSRYGVIHDSFGFAQADDDIEASTHGQESTFEYIRETNPDVLFVIDRSAAIGADGATGASSLLDNDLVNATNAAQNGKIIYLSSDIWYLATGGIGSTEVMLEEVAIALA